MFSGDIRWDLKRPCENCPFANTEHSIKFACRERAEEIEESAYRNGFPCHVHAENVEESEYDEGGYVFGDTPQHCWGAIAMYLKNGSGNVPWEYAIEEDPELEARWWKRCDMEAYAKVFDGEEEFINGSVQD